MNTVKIITVFENHLACSGSMTTVTVRV